MVFISYAQNFEDVMLWRAFKDLATGFYIDVGAAHPDVDSVTRAFYDRGWSGINIEPSSGFFPRLAATRMRDVNLNVTLGAESGTSTFYRVSGSGLSTSAPDVAAANRQAGWESEESLVECMTLADVCRRHAPADIHFLKIDVEGSERAVLAGADFDSFRPWVVLVEATRPMSREPNHQDWEPILVNAGYRSVWFDGLNRFYIAKEREPALRECFILPPNVFDDFLRTVDTEATHKIAECQAELQQSQAQVEALRAQVQERVAWEQNLLASMASAKETWRAEATMLQGDIAHARKARDHAEARTAALLNSTSWRITAPMRAIARLRHRPAPPVGDAAEQAEPPHMPVLPPSETTAIASRNGPPDALPPPSPPVGEKSMGISGRGRIWIDVEDLFEYARGNPRPSGIQRLAYEIYRELHERHGSNGFIYFVRNASGAHDFYVVQWSEIAALFAAFDSIPHFREIQLAAARKKSWDAELPEYRADLFGSDRVHSLHVDLFCFDMTVLTNGPGEKAVRKLSKIAWHDEVERMKQIHAAMKTSPDYKDDEERRSDILERERCIIDGFGEVHDDDYDLRAFALLPEPK